MRDNKLFFARAVDTSRWETLTPLCHPGSGSVRVPSCSMASLPSRKPMFPARRLNLPVKIAVYVEGNGYVMNNDYGRNDSGWLFVLQELMS